MFFGEFGEYRNAQMRRNYPALVWRFVYFYNNNNHSSFVLSFLFLCCLRRCRRSCALDFNVQRSSNIVWNLVEIRYVHTASLSAAVQNFTSEELQFECIDVTWHATEANREWTAFGIVSIGFRLVAGQHQSAVDHTECHRHTESQLF